MYNYEINRFAESSILLLFVKIILKPGFSDGNELETFNTPALSAVGF